MPANTQPIFPLTPKFATAAIANADGQTVKAVYTAGANGGRVSRFSLTSTDTVNHDVGIYINGTLIATVSVPLGAGTASTIAPKDVMGDTDFKQVYYDACGNLVIDLPAGAVLGINAPVTVTAAKAITGNVCAADF